MGSQLIEEIGALHETIEHLKNATTRLLARAEEAEEKLRAAEKENRVLKERVELDDRLLDSYVLQEQVDPDCLAWEKVRTWRLCNGGILHGKQ